MKFLKILIPSLFLFSGLCSAQVFKSKLDFVGGVSAREYIHAGLRYQYTEITQLGVYFGGDLGIKSDESISTFCIDNMIHLGKLNFYSNRPVWYLRQGYTYLKNRLGDQETRKYSYIDLSGGREFPINDWLGFNADFGLLIQFREYKEQDPPLDFPLNTYWHYMPLARLQFYISF
jgi:hypothetical protein